MALQASRLPPSRCITLLMYAVPSKLQGVIVSLQWFWLRRVEDFC